MILKKIFFLLSILLIFSLCLLFVSDLKTTRFTSQTIGKFDLYNSKDVEVDVSEIRRNKINLQEGMIITFQNNEKDFFVHDFENDFSRGILVSKNTLELGPGFESQENSTDVTFDMAIARWNVIPYQKVDSSFDFGVVAFHHKGILYVEVSANGGPPLKVKSTQFNQRTNTIEYMFNLNLPSKYNEKIEIRAKAVPVEGDVRYLEPLYLYGKGEEIKDVVYVSLNKNPSMEEKIYPNLSEAIKNVSDAGEIILKDAGTYTLQISKIQRAAGELSRRWVTIKPAKGLNRKDVILSMNKGSEHFRTPIPQLKFENVTFDVRKMRQIYTSPSQEVWLDQCLLYKSKGSDERGNIVTPVRYYAEYHGSYATKSTARGTLYGFAGLKLVRNCYMENIIGDALQNSKMVINCHIQEMDGEISKHHSDILQYFGNHDNVIVYGVLAKKINKVQNFFFDHNKSSFRNMAFVNILIENSKSKTPCSQFSSESGHVLFYHTASLHQKFLFREDQLGDKKFLTHGHYFRNSIFGELSSISKNGESWALPQNVFLEDCHVQKGQPASGLTLGDYEFLYIGKRRVDYKGPSYVSLTAGIPPIERFPYPTWVAVMGQIQKGPFGFNYLVRH